MEGLRLPELIIILVIFTVLFGGAKLPQLGAGLGKAIRSFKDALSGKDEGPPAQGPPPQELPPAGERPGAADAHDAPRAGSNGRA